MGSSHEHNKRKRRNSDCISNYVDRVRICDTKSITSESVYSKASSQKSGWRQKSYSSIDLSCSGDYQPGAGAFRYRDFDAPDDTSVKNLKNGKNKENQRDYEDIYNVNPKAQGYKREIIKEHNKINQNQRDNDVCSLRRSKSLAVIREETFNDLTIAGPKSRRSQLIPRAKLIDRHFFKDRLSFALEEGLSFSLDSNLTGENIKTSCGTIKSNNSGGNATNASNNNGTGSNNSTSNANNNYFSWSCDKSDLDSIDSNFFKNSLHQSALLEKLCSLKNDSAATKFVSRAEIHNEHNRGAEADDLVHGNGSVSGGGSVSTRKSENIINDNESIVNINEDTESGITIIEIKDKKQLSGPTSSVISYDSIYLSSESDKQTVLGEILIDSNNHQQQRRHSSGSNTNTNNNSNNHSNFEDIDSKIRDFEKIIRELNLIGENEKSDTIIDNLYSQVAKGSSGSLFDLTINGESQKIDSDTLGKYTDYISKGTLERLAILSGFNPHSGNGRKPTKEARKSKDAKLQSGSGSHKGEFQYSSLPDVDISKLLRDCELIDAKLRDDVSIELLEPYPDYDIDLELSNEHPDSLNLDEINNNNNHHHHHHKEQQLANDSDEEAGEKSRTNESIERHNRNIDSASAVAGPNSIEPISLDEENPKGAPSIEVVQLPTKELDYCGAAGAVIDSVEKKNDDDDERLRNTTKIYIADLGLELDYENSIASFESDEDFGSPQRETAAAAAEAAALVRKEALTELNQLHQHHPYISLYNPPTINLVTISGRKVIVDELAAKSEQKDTAHNNNNNNIINNSSRDRETFYNKKNREQKPHSQQQEEPAKKAVRIEKPRRASTEESSSTSSSSSQFGNGAKDKLNGADKGGSSSHQHRANIDKRVERKITPPECKQRVDNAADKEKLFRKNSSVDECYSNYTKNPPIENSHNLDSEKAARQERPPKDYTSFCILQKSNLEHSNKMPRPQLLNIVDSKNSTPKQQMQPSQTSPLQRSNLAGSNKDIRIIISNEADDDRQHQQQHPLNATEKEFLHKVDSVRNYWSKMLVDNPHHHGDDTKRNNLKSMSKAFSASKSSNDIPQSLRNEDGFQSFFPTVEIVELNNGETQAALVTARKLNDVEFDHVRYKVMKSEMFQKNIVRSNKHRKETQFDGLMQYLQDYSFQELLANNNVVIIEPVRTKIEKVAEKPTAAQSAVCKITNGAGTGLTRNNSNNLKKHFFYHPIRVNKELYEDELPVPDTVRNVRKLFEESLRAKLATSKDTKMSKSSDNLKPRKTIRYLTIDTSFDNNLATSKWDSISLSSGVSSAADLSSPCECQEGAAAASVVAHGGRNSSSNGSKENLLDHNDESERATPFVSADVLEKIRECEPSIEYYSQVGGVGVPPPSSNESEKVNSELATRVSAKEKCNCQGRQSHRCTSSSNEKHHHHQPPPPPPPQQQQQLPSKKMNNDYTGLKFKLVKSNSCSSRLELAGTGSGSASVMEEMRNIVHGQHNQLYDEDGQEEFEAEEAAADEVEDDESGDKGAFERKAAVKDVSIKEMIYKLETRNFAPTKPRIIESRCIEKKAPHDAKVTINNQSLEKVKHINSNSTSSAGHVAASAAAHHSNIDSHESVTVNNHISILNAPTAAAAVVSAVSHNTSEQQSNPIQGGDNGGEGKMAMSKPKIVRNKNVDLALAAANKKKEIGKSPKGQNGNGVTSSSSSSSSSSSGGTDTETMLLAHNELHEISSAFARNNNNNVHNGAAAAVRVSRHSTSSSSSTPTAMQSVEMVKNQDKINYAHHAKHSANIIVAASSPEAMQKSADAMALSDESHPEQQQTGKMVNWSTVGILSREYIANDNKLTQKKTFFDEMDFEEFEVAGEHYDSLNSK